MGADGVGLTKIKIKYENIKVIYLFAKVHSLCNNHNIQFPCLILFQLLKPEWVSTSTTVQGSKNSTKKHQVGSWFCWNAMNSIITTGMPNPPRFQMLLTQRSRGFSDGNGSCFWNLVNFFYVWTKKNLRYLFVLYNLDWIIPNFGLQFTLW